MTTARLQTQSLAQFGARYDEKCAKKLDPKGAGRQKRAFARLKALTKQFEVIAVRPEGWGKFARATASQLFENIDIYYILAPCIRTNLLPPNCTSH